MKSLYLLVIIVLSALVVGGSVKALGGFSWSSVEQKLAEMLFEKISESAVVLDEEVSLGGANNATRFPHGLDLTSSGFLSIDGTEVIGAGGDISIASSDYLLQGSQKFLVTSGNFADATTTLFCQSNPLSVTSTADLASAKITGIATTSVALIMATSTQQTGLTTSTAGFGVNGGGQLLNINLLTNTTVTNTVFHGGILADPKTNQTSATATRINVGPNEYVCGVVGEGNGGSTAGITGAANLFAGTYSIGWLGY